ncbi:hypothetical protein Tco_0179988 [Tanacetum coccineum]
MRTVMELTWEQTQQDVKYQVISLESYADPCDFARKHPRIIGNESILQLEILSGRFFLIDSIDPHGRYLIGFGRLFKDGGGGVMTVMPITIAEEKAQRRLEVKARKIWLQKLVSQLELLDEKLSQEDVNQKLLRSLSPEWNTHVVVWRNKADLDTMSMDDLYNNLKVYEPEVKGMSSSSSSTQNMAFVSSSNNNTSSTNGATLNTRSSSVNTALSSVMLC